MGHIISAVVLCAVLLLRASPLAAQQITPVPKDPNLIEGRYVSSDGRVLSAQFNLKDKKVTVSLPGEEVRTMPLALSASGARYSDGKQTFWEHQGVGRYIVDDKVRFEGALMDDPGESDSEVQHSAGNAMPPR